MHEPAENSHSPQGSQPPGTRHSMQTHGDHCICELSGCDAQVLNDLEAIKAALYEAASSAEATVLNGFFHRFNPIGVSGVLCLSESHLSIHTWPEAKYAAVDIYTCGDTVKPANAIAVLAAALQAQHTYMSDLDRGQDFDGNGVFSHRLNARANNAEELK